MSLLRRKPRHDSKKALEDAKQSLHIVKSRAPEVREVATALKEMRERNHFADKLIAIMGGEPIDEGH